MKLSVGGSKETSLKKSLRAAGICLAAGKLLENYRGRFAGMNGNVVNLVHMATKLQ